LKKFGFGLFVGLGVLLDGGYGSTFGMLIMALCGA
jgi:hypothetical protein